MQVYALTKERDALRRGSEKLNSVNELLKEKDNIIAQVCSSAATLPTECSTTSTGALACLLYRPIEAAACICPVGPLGQQPVPAQVGQLALNAVALGLACR